MPTKENEYPTPQELDAAIETFFTMEHTEGGKQVSANELLTMRTETIPTAVAADRIPKDPPSGEPAPATSSTAAR